jgi:hypothetical protein
MQNTSIEFTDDPELVQFRYTLNVKLGKVAKPAALDCLFPSVEDIVLSSREFIDAAEASTSMANVMAEFCKGLNAAMKTEKYALFSEINPTISSKETISKDWKPNELAKLWIIDASSKLQSKAIHALGLGQLLEIDPELDEDEDDLMGILDMIEDD